MSTPPVPSAETVSAADSGAVELAPLVSVIVPAFNAAGTLARTLRSVAAQEYRRLEILIVDDGSTDDTAEVAALFCAGEPRARLLRKANGGVASARNHAVAQACGDYVAPIDADDVWHPRKIVKQVAAALTAPEPPGFVYCWFRGIECGDLVWRDGPPLSVLGRAVQRLACYNFVGNGSSPLFSRQALSSVGGYDERLRLRGAEGCEDLLVQLAVARLYPVLLVPEYLVGYRLTSSSLSTEPNRMHRSWRLALELFGEEPRLSPRAIRWSEAARVLLLAETHFLRGRLVLAVQMLGRAIWLDPVRTGLHLLCRTARSLARPAASGKQERRGFDDHDTTRPSAVTDVWLQRLVGFDQRRLDRLEALEQSTTPVAGCPIPADPCPFPGAPGATSVGAR